MTCREVDELAAAYTLGAMPPEERERVREHLRICAAHQNLMHELEATVGVIEQGVDVIEPPPSLRSQILEAVSREAHTETPTAAPRSPRWRIGGLTLQPITAVLAVLVLGLLVWNVALQFSGGDDAFARYMPGDDEAHGWVYYVEEVGVVTVEGMAPLPQDQAYQAWAIIDGELANLGLLTVSGDGDGYILLSQHVTESEPVFITVEAPGGTTSPSGEPILTTER